MHLLPALPLRLETYFGQAGVVSTRLRMDVLNVREV